MHLAGQVFRGTDSLSVSCPVKIPTESPALRGKTGIAVQPVALRAELPFGIKENRLPLGDAAVTGTR